MTHENKKIRISWKNKTMQLCKSIIGHAMARWVWRNQRGNQKPKKDRQYNDQKKKRQTTIYQIVHRNL